ncbi:MAG: hypothetical protein ACRCTJ_01245 [Brevinema sp.]
MNNVAKKKVNKKQLLSIFASVFLSISTYADNLVNHASLLGAWSYFHVTKDVFSDQKLLATEQRLIFRDAQNVTLIISAKESEFVHDTIYNLKYTLSLHDNVTYLTLFSTESKKVIGAYVRMPLSGALEMASDPNFIQQKQLYKKVSVSIPSQIPKIKSSTPNPNIIK